MHKKPNRTKKRVFTPCDAARVARQAVYDDPDVTPEIVLACIAKGMNFTYISLSRQTVVESAVDITKVDPRLLALAVKKLVELIERTPWLKRFLVGSLPALRKAFDYLSKVDTLDPPQATVDDVLEGSKCNCKYSNGEDILHGYKNEPRTSP